MSIIAATNTFTIDTPIEERHIYEYEFVWTGCHVTPEQIKGALDTRNSPIMDLWNYTCQGSHVNHKLLLGILGWNESLTPCSSMRIEDAARKLRRLDGYKAMISPLTLPEHASVIVSVGQCDRVTYIHLYYRNYCDKNVLRM